MKLFATKAYQLVTSFGRGCRASVDLANHQRSNMGQSSKFFFRPSFVSIANTGISDRNASTSRMKANCSSRSEARRVGKEFVSTCRYRGSPNHEKKKKRKK